MDLEQVLKDINQRRNDIEQRSNEITKKISCLYKDIDQIPIKYYNRTKQFQEEQRLILVSKINLLESNLNKWIDDQNIKIESKLNKFRDQIVKKNEQYSNNLLNLKSNFEIS